MRPLATVNVTTCWHCPHTVRSGVYETVRCPSFCQSFCLSQHGPTASGLLLWARRVGDIDRSIAAAAACRRRRAQFHVVGVRRNWTSQCVVNACVRACVSRCRLRPDVPAVDRRRRLLLRPAPSAGHRRLRVRRRHRDVRVRAARLVARRELRLEGRQRHHRRHHTQRHRLRTHLPTAPRMRLAKLRYDTRCCFSVRSQADTSRLNLPHGTNS